MDFDKYKNKKEHPYKAYKNGEITEEEYKQKNIQDKINNVKQQVEKWNH